MKRLFFIGVILLFGLQAFSQIYLDGMAMSKLVKDDYILIAVPYPFSRTRAYYRMPQRNGFLMKKKIVITDANGNPLKFNTVTGVIQLFEDNGWVYRDHLNDFSSSTVGLADAKLYLLFERKPDFQRDSM